MPNIFKKLFPSANEREVKRLMRQVEAVNDLEPRYEAMSDRELAEQTQVFRDQLKGGSTLEDILPKAYALVREGAKRVFGKRLFDMQILGGIVLHQGRIAEMKTGEGKTLTAVLAAYLNALTGEGVHVVTVNDYLASFQSESMGLLYRFLGLTVGLVIPGMEPDEKRQAYQCDITYGTNNEFGFDYLRDNMVVSLDQQVQRKLHYAIVDEVDSILIDEARTPLIISGMGEDSTEIYAKADAFVRRLTAEADYTVDEKMKAVTLTEEGIRKAERYFGIDNLSDMDNTAINHHINQALKAHALFQRDRDYIVQNDEVIIVDEFTGRLMIGRRYSEGLHQAIEAKEKVKVQQESKTLATITLQNYFRMYEKLSGMTGTAATEEEEFRSIYNMDVVEVPTNRPMIRQDLNDVVYKSVKGKFAAVVEEVVQRHEKGQPILVGTVSVEKSEILSSMLDRRGVPHVVLNAKYHAKEAEIVAQAGQKGAVTIATNMAGRGTDILLGGNPEYMARQEMRRQGYTEEMVEEAVSITPSDEEEVLKARAEYQKLYNQFKVKTDAAHDEVVALGGLHIIGTERHESRRIDNQLRGRSGRQGDPGSSRFYIALEDDLMRLFGSERVENLMDKMGLDDDVPIELGFLSSQIESAQKKVEVRNFDIRKHVLQYDDVMNQQRTIIYQQRRQVLEGKDLSEAIAQMRSELLDRALDTFASKELESEDWDIRGLMEYLRRIYLPEGALSYTPEQIRALEREKLKEDLEAVGQRLYAEKEAEITEAGISMRAVEHSVLLRMVDTKWMDHIDNMDQLRKGIGLRAVGQRDPVVEYKFEGFDMFTEMVNAIQEDTLTILYHIHVDRVPERKQVAQPVRTVQPGDEPEEPAPKQPARKLPQVGRNDPCPCGSGLKYKKCHGKNQA